MATPLKVDHAPLQLTTPTLEVVVVWILCHATIYERPREVVHCILLVLHRLGNHLSIEMIVHEVIQVGLHVKSLW